MNLSPHFTLDEMTVSQAGARHGIMNRPNVDEVENLRRLCKFILEPLRAYFGPVVISSGFRSAGVNRLVGGASSSQHVIGQAADIIVPGVQVTTVAAKVRSLQLPFDQLIDEFSQWTHVSYSARHRRQFLLARRISGSTKYIPG